MSDGDVTDHRFRRDAGRTYSVTGLGVIVGLIIMAETGWHRSTVSVPESILTGICLGLAEASVLLNGYLWLGRRISTSPRCEKAQIPKKTAGWIWAAYQGAALPLTVTQHRFQQGEIGTLLALIVVTGQEFFLRAVQAGLTPIHPLLGIGASVALGIVLVMSPRTPWFHSLFAVLQGTLVGLAHALVFTITGSLTTVMTATAATYLVLKRL